MTDNMKILIDQVTTAINSEYGDSLPTLEQINDKADTFRTLFAPLYPISDEEYIRVKRELWLIRPKKMTWHFGEQLEVFGQPLIFFAFSQLFSHSI